MSSTTERRSASDPAATITYPRRDLFKAIEPFLKQNAPFCLKVEGQPGLQDLIRRKFALLAGVAGDGLGFFASIRAAYRLMDLYGCRGNAIERGYTVVCDTEKGDMYIRFVPDRNKHVSCSHPG